ncbi:MAG: DNA-processing protein DprA [Planctomycetaceae bacterium]|jgi:DNA processing protein|nr:DNA-processing protein DprA [Planctomycetaceae bacterium]
MFLNDTLLDDILLSLVEGIGSRTYCLLLKRFGSATAVLNASRSDLAGYEFLKPETADNLAAARKSIDPAAVAFYCEKKNISIISLQDSRYPPQLRSIIDPPPLLYVKGSILPQDAFSLAVIGTRRCSSYGQRQTERLTAALVSNGLTVISGLALGIDSIAHRTALKSGGRTLAVLGSGLNRIYPPEHMDLAEKIIASGGAVLSEYPPLQHSAKWTFPQRNRIVSGLALGVLVIEAPLRSGAMISARLAGEQGRELFAVPGRIDSPVSQGCHQLIRDGAFLTESADDILNALGPLRQPVLFTAHPEAMRHPNEVSLNEAEENVLRCIKTEATDLETIVLQSGLELHQIVTVLDILERKRIIRLLSPLVFVRI